MTFYKDGPSYIVCETDVSSKKSLPVLKFILKNCRRISEIDFDFIDIYDDGVHVYIRRGKNQTVFETIDLGGRKVKMICDEVIKKEEDYSREDFINFMKELLKQRDNEREVADGLWKKEEELKKFLSKELDIAERKLKQANWLSEERKGFLKGKIETMQEVNKILEEKSKKSGDTP